jgi:hypothetical protein
MRALGAAHGHGRPVPYALTGESGDEDEEEEAWRQQGETAAAGGGIVSSSHGVRLGS